jgi:hypothetical protein
MGSLVFTAVLATASRSLAGQELPYVKLPEDSAPSTECSTLFQRAIAVHPDATACTADSDCEHYPCSCAAISKNLQAIYYKALIVILQHDCGASVTYAYCGETMPTCEQGVCRTRTIPVQN